jgi:hypothetical protein
MKIGRYIPFYRAFLVDQEPVRLPPGVELVEVRFERELATQGAAKLQVKALLTQRGLESVRCQRKAIDALVEEKNTLIVEAAVIVFQAMQNEGAKGGRCFNELHVKIARALQAYFAHR